MNLEGLDLPPSQVPALEVVWDFDGMQRTYVPHHICRAIAELDGLRRQHPVSPVLSLLVQKRAMEPAGLQEKVSKVFISLNPGGLPYTYLQV